MVALDLDEDLLVLILSFIKELLDNLAEKSRVSDQVSFAAHEVDCLVEEKIESAIAVELGGEHFRSLQMLLCHVGLRYVGGLVALDQVEVEHQLEILLVDRRIFFVRWL